METILGQVNCINPGIRGVFADFSFQANYESFSDKVTHQAKRCVLDFLGVALGGNNVGLAPHILDLFSGMGGLEEATVYGEAGLFPVLTAAMVNAAKGHALDMDDGHRFANAHPGATIIPAAIAVAEKENASGIRLIEGIVAGYETFIRIARAINPSHLGRGFHSTGTVGAFGAAVACSKILQLGRTETANALSIAGLQSAGLLEVLSSGQIMKPLHTAKASQAGVISALLAGKGLQGPELIFEGNKGFIKAYSDASITTEMVNGLGEKFEIENVYFKRYAACRHIHPALDAVGNIMNVYELEAEDISEIKVYTYTLAKKLTGQIGTGDNELEAKFSLPTSIGLMIRYGKVDADEYEMNKINDSTVQRIAERVEIITEKERDFVYPQQRGARVCINAGARDFTAEVSLPKGDPEVPFSDGELIDKFFVNASKTLPEVKVSALIEKVFDLEAITVRELTRVMAV